MSNINLIEIYNSLLEKIPTPLWIEDIDSKIVFVNKFYENKFNVKLKDVEGKNIEGIFNEKIEQTYKEAVKVCKLNKKIYKYNIDTFGTVSLLPIRGRGNSIVAIIGIYNEKKTNTNLLQDEKMKYDILSSFKDILKIKDIDTDRHTTRVVEYIIKFAENINLNKEKIDELILCANLHDIGKIAMPEHILTKPGSLTDEEYEIMKTHTEKGYRLLKSLGEEGTIAKSVLTHHERWDGKGYPLGLKSEEIPLFSRIIAIADSYDAMTHERVYRKPMKKDEAINELKRCSGTQFDPELVDIFIKYIE
ncbi:MAG: HD domain-containing phosphohydrolase [Peptostreptococcaceae bacterium]